MNQQFLLFIYLLAMFSNCSGSKKIGVVSEKGDLEKTKTLRNAFLKEAVFYGLQKDHFPKRNTAYLLGQDSIWVVKCPICDNVKRGIWMYGGSDFKPKKSKISKKEFSNLWNGDAAFQKVFLKELVDRYVAQYYSVLEMTEEQRKKMHRQLELGRKDGMSVANGGEGFYCASCDGACRIEK